MCIHTQPPTHPDTEEPETEARARAHTRPDKITFLPDGRLAGLAFSTAHERREMTQACTSQPKPSSMSDECSFPLPPSTHQGHISPLIVIIVQKISLAHTRLTQVSRHTHMGVNKEMAPKLCF